MRISSYKKVVYVGPQTLLGRLCATVCAILLLVIGMFFFTGIIILAAVLIFCLVIPLFWHKQKIRLKETKQVIDGEIIVDNQIEYDKLNNESTEDLNISAKNGRDVDD